MCSELDDEIDLLMSMYSADELIVERFGAGAKIIAALLPCTAGDPNMQLSSCELHVHITESYPQAPPVLELGTSRGLSDAARSNILTRLQSSMEDFIGQPMISMLLESGREAITEVNGSESMCSICLNAIQGANELMEVVRLPCVHVFHKPCLIDYCQSKLKTLIMNTPSVDKCKVLCPECRAEIKLESFGELNGVFRSLTHSGMSVSGKDCAVDDPATDDESALAAYSLQPSHAGYGPSDTEHSVHMPEAFVRLHHLYQGNDEKEKPLMRLLKEFGLNAAVFYGKPALMHIQGAQKDVDSFAGTAKRRHITISIDVVQRSDGPGIPQGISYTAAKKGSLDSSAFAQHLSQRGLGETAFTVIGT